MESMLSVMGEGTRAVVFAERADGTGHAFNAVVADGRVVFLDAERVGRARLVGYKTFHVFFTQIGGGW